MNTACGCCEGIEKLTPMLTANRPGLDALAYRVGTHATFLETMKARLSSHYLEIEELDDQGRPRTRKIYPLRALRTRAANDPAIALLDAWAIVADVLTFYQERIANEGYLRTAAERRSIVELARLVGYALRPGVASSVYLAFTLEQDHDVEIPAGTRGQSLPGPGELPQSFETSEPLNARHVWNQLQARLTRPQLITLDRTNRNPPNTDARIIPVIYFQGTSTNLKPNDPLVIVFGPADGQQVFRRVAAVELQPAEDRTKVTLQPSPAFSTGAGISRTTAFHSPGLENVRSAFAGLGQLVGPLSRPPSVQPANALRLGRSVVQSFAAESDLLPRFLTTFAPTLRATLYQAWRGVAVPPGAMQAEVYALRVTAPLFGHNAAKETLDEHGAFIPAPFRVEWKPDTDEGGKVIFLDTVYEQIPSGPGSYVAIQKPGEDPPKIYGNISVSSVSRDAYLVNAKVTKITLAENSEDWWSPEGGARRRERKPEGFSVIRGTTVYAQSEKLDLAEEPIDTVQTPQPVTGAQVELDRLYDGLDSGRWLIVAGERTDLGVSGVTASELVMLAGVQQGLGSTPRSGDRPHTLLQLAQSLAYSYKRDTVTLYANVVKATHGETRNEVLGSGDSSKALQRFTLKQSPLTYLAAPTPAGAESTLRVRVNDILWPQTDSLAGLKATDRRYITLTDDDRKTTLIFGNGERGARLPSGLENVKALYRSGIGKGGNVKAKQISLLGTRPLGVKEVINPLPATGGADADTRDQARRNTPLALMALDRLVSVQDYADFARSFAGIGKAAAVRLSDGRRQLVHVTIAGIDDIPIDKTSDLYLNLVKALHDFGDPHQPIQVEVREVILLVLSAKVRILLDYQWESVEPRIRAALLDTFSFERRELGQDVVLSEVLSTIQMVKGIAYVDVDVLDAVEEGIDLTRLSGLAGTLGRKDRIVVDMTKVDPTATDPAERIRPAQLAYLSPEIPDTLILSELTT